MKKEKLSKQKLVREKSLLTLEKDYIKILKTLELYCYLKHKLTKDQSEDIISKAVLFHLEHKDRFDSTKSSITTYLELKCTNFIQDMFRSTEYKRLVYVGSIFEIE